MICVVVLACLAVTTMAQVRMFSCRLAQDSVQLVFQDSYYITANHKHSVQDEFFGTRLLFPYYFMIDDGYTRGGGYYTVELMLYQVHCAPDDYVVVDSIMTAFRNTDLVPATLRDVVFLIKDFTASGTPRTFVCQQYFCLEDLQRYGIFTAEIPYSVFFGFESYTSGIIGTVSSFGMLRNGDIIILKNKDSD